MNCRKYLRFSLSGLTKFLISPIPRELMISLLVYISFLIFSSILLYKIIKLSRRLYLRCDLYPLPQIPKSYGGSYYEEVGWWKIKRRKSIFGLIKAIFNFVLINRKKMSLQPRHWFATFLFHLGIFTHIFWLILLVLCTFITPSTVALQWIHATGSLGLLLMLSFSFYLFFRKLRAPLRHYTPFEDYFILLFVILTSSSGILAIFEVDILHVVEVVSSLISFSKLPELSLFETLHIISFSLLVLMVPFTRITHYIAVFFAHFVLWDDRQAEELEPLLSETLKNFRVRWSDHSNPERSWEEEVKVGE